MLIFLPLIKQQSLLILSLFLLTGCGLFQSSELQVEVSKARHSEAKNEDATETVRKLLVARNIHHKVVQFRYNVSARPLIVPLGNAGFSSVRAPLAWLPLKAVIRERKGIIYRDDTHRGKPWWYIDRKVRRPIWLPSSSVEHQLTFAMKRRIDLLQIMEFDPTLKSLNTNDSSEKSFWNLKFRKAHGTDFNPQSMMDLAKMGALVSAV